MADAALRVTSTSLATSAASAPMAAPRAESARVDRNRAIAATPSMDTVMNPTAQATRSPSCSRDSGAPDSDVTPAPASPPPAPPRAPPGLGHRRGRAGRARAEQEHPDQVRGHGDRDHRQQHERGQ